MFDFSVLSLYIINMGEIIFDTKLNELFFSKANFAPSISEEGVLLCSKGSSLRNMSFSFDIWKFDSFKFNENTKTVCLYGESKTNSTFKSLYDIFLEAKLNKDNEKLQYEKARAAFCVCKAISFLFNKDVSIENIGAGGIFVSSDKIPSVIFLPQKLFESACSCRGNEDYTKLNSVWRFKSLPRKSSLSFTQAIIAYYAITNNLPYSELDEIKRNADLKDTNFLKLEHVINGIDSTFAKNIDNALCLPSFSMQKNAQDINGNIQLDLDFLYNELGLSEDGKLIEVVRKSSIDENEFNNKVKSYYKSKSRSVKASRTLRRNKAIFIGSIIFAIILSFFIYSAIIDSGKKPTSISLTSFQTVEAFYKSINKLDIELLSEMSTGKVSKKYSDVVSSYYVVSKMRSAYEAQNETISIGKWLLLQAEKDEFYNRFIYCITNFQIDGARNFMQVDVPLRNMKKTALSNENNMALTNGSSFVHTVEYYTITTNGSENDFSIIKSVDKVTLTFKKDKWLVSKIDASDFEIEINQTQFKRDVLDALKNKDVLIAADLLHQKYQWFPDAKELEIEKKDLLQSQF